MRRHGRTQDSRAAGGTLPSSAAIRRLHRDSSTAKPFACLARDELHTELSTDVDNHLQFGDLGVLRLDRTLPATDVSSLPAKARRQPLSGACCTSGASAASSETRRGALETAH